MINKWDQKIEVGKKEFSRADKKAFQAFKEEKKNEREEVEDAGSNKRASFAFFDRLSDHGRGQVSDKLKRANQVVPEAQSEAIEAKQQDSERRLKENNDQ